MSFGGITFVGADESVDPTALSTITSFYFPVEWALCLCKERQGQAEGYPSLEWMEELPREARLAGHLRGRLCEEFVQGEDRELVEAYGPIWSRLDRIQLDLSTLPTCWEATRFAALVRKHAGKTFIVPLREDNQRVAEALMKELGALGDGTRSGRSASPRVAVLFDLSALPAEWPQGRKAYVACGYAGGLTPENVREQVPRIHRRALRAQSWWMHLDRGLRGNPVSGSRPFGAGGKSPDAEPSGTARNARTRFELNRCRQALDEIGRYFLDYSI
ncbi:MAG TPA: hypothetical protein VGD78_07005 [Chthoniobacterales bacterium]